MPDPYEALPHLILLDRAETLRPPPPGRWRRCQGPAVSPVGGWWKNIKRRDLRYCLIVSLRTREQTADLYTPIAAQLSVPVPTTVHAT